MIFEIINPSDPYTMEAVDLEVAAIAICIIGEGKYGLRELTGDKSGNVPVFLIGGHNEWFMKQFGRNLEESMNYISETRTAELCKALASVTIGDINNRRAMEEILKRADTIENYQSALMKMHDEKRTSMNDIGRTAWGMADFIHERFGNKTIQ